MISILDAAGKRHEGLKCELTLPLRGNWLAHVETGDDVAPTGPVTLEIARNGQPGAFDRFVGTIRRGGAWQGRSEVVIVGGAGALVRTPLAPQHFATRSSAAVPAELVAQQILDAAGERLDGSSALAELELPQWTVAATSAAVALGLLADQLRLGWRVLDTGAVWIGPEAWPTVATADLGYELAEHPDAQVIEAGPDKATLRPGVVVLGRQISRVSYSVTGGGIRVRLGYGVAPDRADIEAAVRGFIPPPVYSQTAGATVVAQHADDTLDLDVDDGRLPALRRVPFRAGIVGARVLLARGTRVRVSFENGAPSGAYAHAPDTDPTASRGVARHDDTVFCGSWKIVGAPDARLVQTTIIDPDGTTISGRIESSSSELLLR